ncbi:hypothetical protein IMSHALPRED_007247 [Imshaugia aleurites]|uniref:SGNH hydrolase-type esterase domain-containing protein n=1 Tax=Imshaugia aleurites TaxID=172621 RepID=A0A8H3IGW4_9LECA|nr:hypothetical protein IMSHALPRED_007247 [Imshaugia aleurites]
MATHTRILCFGASITTGWSQLGLRYYPYASTLEARLKEALPNRHFSIQVDGLPGDTVIEGQYTKRLRSLISTATCPYDWIIVQGGGNDILSCREPNEIIEALRKLWSIAFEAGSKVIALTVTDTIGGETDALRSRYDALNELIVSEEHEKLYSVDVCNMLPPATMENVMVGRIYDRDGVHLGKKGYEMMGDAIASSLIEMIRAEPHEEHTGGSTNRIHRHHFNASNS